MSNETFTFVSMTFKTIMFYFIVEQIPYINTFLWFYGKHSTLGRNCGIILSTGFNILQARKTQAHKVCYCSFLSKLIDTIIIKSEQLMTFQYIVY